MSNIFKFLSHLNDAHAPSTPIVVCTDSASLPSLPPEIICHIFWMLSWSDPPRKRPQQSGFDIGWIVVSHVCQRWRRIALGDASLWGQINFNTMSDVWLAETISRIGPSRVPLFVTLRGARGQSLHSSSVQEKNIFCQKNFPRLLGLSISSSRHNDLLEQFLQYVISDPVPLLELLRIPHISYPSPTITPPFHLSASIMPRLTSLYLVGYALDWQAPHLSHLVHLKLEAYYVHVNVSKEIFYSALARMTRLETLCLIRNTPKADVADTGVRVTMPSLVSLELAGVQDDCIGVIDRLALPSLKTFQINQHRDINASVPPAMPQPRVNFHPSASNTSRLESMFLHLTALDWSSALLSNLVHLAVTVRGAGAGPHTDFIPEKHTFLDALARMVRLETLDLQDTIPRIVADGESRSPGPTQDITLPSLLKLHLVGLQNDCVNLVNLLNLPSLHLLDIAQRAYTESVVTFRPSRSRTPRLRSLRLHSCALNWESPLLAELTDLTVEEGEGDPDVLSSNHRPDTCTLSRGLRQMTGLQTLRLQFGTLIMDGVSNEDGPFQGSEDISLPSLVSLYLSGGLEYCADVIKHMKLPSSTRRDLRLIAERAIPHTLIPHFSPFTSTDLLPRAMLLACDEDSSSHLNHSTLRLWSSHQNWRRQGPTVVDIADLTVSLLAAPQMIPEIAAWQSLRLENVDALVLHFTPRENWTQSRWRRLLEQARAVEVLHLHGAQDAVKLVQALLPPQSSLSDMGGSGLLFPALEELHIWHFSINTLRIEDTPFSEALCACMEARRDAGHPVRKVRLMEDASWLARLRASVAHVQIIT